MILEESRQGPLTARISDRYIHSRYSPQKEAEQYFERWISDNGLPRKLIIIEPGLGYLIKTLAERYKPEELFIIFLSSDTRDYCIRNGIINGIDNILFDKSDSELQRLSIFLDDADLRDTAVMEWPASLKIFDSESSVLQKQIIKLFRIKQGNQITEKKFSRLWFRNGVSNFIRFDYSSLPGKNLSPVILCASGPSLERHLKKIQLASHSCVIAALPSSLRTLSEHQIEADIVFSTDPGYYAKEHLKYIPPKALLISPLSAASGSSAVKRMGFLQNSSFESYLLKERELPHLAEMGTVAATAIDFLIKWKGDWPLYICGLDLCFNDIKMHASPHSFDPLILANEDRSRPGYSLYYDRASSMTASVKGYKRFTKSMNTYQNWFSLQSFPPEIYRLAPDTVSLNMPVLESLPHFHGKKKFTVDKNRNYPSLDIRKKRVSEFVNTLRLELKLCKRHEEDSSFLQSICRALSMESVEYDTLSLLADKWTVL